MKRIAWAYFPWFVLIVAVFSSCATKTTRAGDEDGFFKEVFANKNLKNIDTTGIPDERLLAGGKDFCDHFDAIKETNTDKNLEKPNHDDFGPTVQEIAKSRFSDAKLISTNETGNAPVLVSYAVGGAAVRNLCPEHKAALG